MGGGGGGGERFKIQAEHLNRVMVECGIRQELIWLGVIDVILAATLCGFPFLSWVL